MIGPQSGVAVTLRYEAAVVPLPGTMGLLLAGLAGLLGFQTGPSAGDLTVVPQKRQLSSTAAVPRPSTSPAQMPMAPQPKVNPRR